MSRRHRPAPHGSPARPDRAAPAVPAAPALHAALILVCAASLLLTPVPGVALDYVEVSPSGSQFPEWDGGSTELEFADLNDDGHVDFVSIGDHGSPYINTDQHGVMVYFGDGSGGWSIHMEGNFGYGGIAIGDANGDGLLDVGYGMHHDYSSTDLGDQLIEVALGDGSGTAWTPWDDGLATSGESWGMMATDFADFDNDGDLDIASHSFGCCNGVHVYRNEGDGTWTQTWARTGGNARAQLWCGDVDGDGNADIAAAYQNGTVFLGDGEGGFTPADTGLPAAGSLGLAGVCLGDVDRDGCADLSFTVQGGVFVYVWRVDHWEDSSAGLPASGDYEITLLRDMNVDGWLDVVAHGEGTCTIWLGDGAGGWTEGGGFYDGPASSTEALAAGGDVDHNGYPDIACVQREGSWPSDRNHLHVYRENSTPSARFVVPQFPRGNETLVAGSVQTIRWSAAHVGTEPASITLELSVTGSGGPWLPIAVGVPDGGHRQWTVSGGPSQTARIRVSLSQAGETVSATTPAFRIVPGGSTGIATPVAGPPASAGWQLAVLGNPVRGSARFRVAGEGPGAPPLPTGRSLALEIYGAGGRLLRRLAVCVPTIDWDLRATGGRRIADGVYLVALTEPATGRMLAARRLVILR